MKVAIFGDQDVAGQGWALSKAMRERGHEAHSFIRNTNYLEYPPDVTPQNLDAGMRALISSADMLHVFDRYRNANGWANVRPDARWVLHQHGALNRGWCRGLPDETHFKADRAHRAKRIVSTLNNLHYVGHDLDRWLPSCIHPESFARSLYSRSEHTGVLIGHSPTFRSIKHTAELIESVRVLQAEGLDVDLDIMEDMAWRDVLRRKAQCDIFFDQLDLCYGVSALEAWGFGIPVVVGLSDETHALVDSVVGYTPYVRASPETLTDVLRELVTNEYTRQEMGEAGRAYVEDFHYPGPVVERLERIYE